MSEPLKLEPVAAFLNEIELVGIYIAEGLLRAARPLDLDAFSASGLPRPKLARRSLCER